MKAALQDGYIVFYCPGCKTLHTVPVEHRNLKQPLWQFNGDLAKPTLSPSVLVTSLQGKAYEQARCHSFVRDGHIEFLSDCTHALAGQTVELPELTAANYIDHAAGKGDPTP